MLLHAHLQRARQSANRACARRNYRAKWARSDTGTVVSVTASGVVLSGLRGAAALGMVHFARGAVGLVTDLRTDATVHVSLLAGQVSRGDSATLHSHAPAILVDPASMSGRFLDPLLRPLDGLGDVLPRGPFARWQPLLSDSPKILDREASTVALPSGYKAIDAFYPLIRGRAHAVSGEFGVGKRSLAVDIMLAVARANQQAVALGLGNEDRARVANRLTAGRAGPDHNSSSNDSDATASTNGVLEDMRAPVHCIYVAIGRSAGHLRQLAHTLRASGAAAYTTVIACPPSSPPALQFLAPLTAAAIGEYHRDTGGHALLVLDDVMAQVDAAKRLAGGGDAVTTIDVRGASEALACMLGGGPALLMDKCAQLKHTYQVEVEDPIARLELHHRTSSGSSRSSISTNSDVGADGRTAVTASTAASRRSEVSGGGSLTGLFIVDTPTAAADGSASSTSRSTAELIDSLLSLSDGIVPLCRSAARSGAFLPLDFERLAGRAGHVAQGEAMRHYVSRAGLMLSQLSEAAGAAAVAAAFQVEPESDADAILDLHTKARMLLLPTSHQLRATQTEGGLDALRVASLGLGGLNYATEDAVTATSTSKYSASRSSIGAGSRAGSASERNSSDNGTASNSSLTWLSALLGGPSIAVPAQVEVAAAAAAAAAASSPVSIGTGAAATAGDAPSDSGRAALLRKLDPAQRSALAAAESRRSRTPNFNLRAGAATVPVDPTRATANFNLRSDARGSGGHLMAYNAVSGDPISASAVQYSSSGSSSILSHSAPWRGSTAGSSSGAHATSARRSSVVLGATPTNLNAFEEETAGSEAALPSAPERDGSSSAASAPLPSHTVTEVEVSSPSSSPAATDYDTSNLGAGPFSSSRLEFRIAPLRQFLRADDADVEVSRSAASAATASAAVAADGAVSDPPAPPASNVTAAHTAHSGRAASLASSTQQLHQLPQQGTPSRTFLTLFLLTHGYVQRVPLNRLLEYERELFSVVSRLPAPPAASVRDSGAAAGSASAQPGATAGTTTAGTDRVSSNNNSTTSSLLDAAVNAPVPRAVIERGLRIDVAAQLRAATLKLAERIAGAVVHSPTYSKPPPPAQVEVVAAAAAPPQRRSLLSVLMMGAASPPASGPRPTPTSVVTGVGADSASTAGTRPTSTSVVEEGEEQLSGHIRLEPGTVWADLPLEWRLLHVVVAEFTRLHLGEPPL